MTATEGRAALNPSGDWFTVLIASPWLEVWRGLAFCPHQLESSSFVAGRPPDWMSKVCLRKTLRAGVGIVKGWSNVGRVCDMDTERASAELRIGELSRRVGVSEYVL